MDRKFLVSTLSLSLLIGMVAFGARSFLNPEQSNNSWAYDLAAPATDAYQGSVIDEESHRFEQVAAVLGQSDSGRHLLSLKETYGVDVKFEEGSGSRFREHKNLILLDLNHDPIKAALFFAHEMQHARAQHEGKQADRKSSARPAYIELRLQEEVTAMATSFQVKMELEQIEIRVAEVTLPMEDLYRQAYQMAAEQAYLVNNLLSEKRLDTIGRAAGEQAMFDAFASGAIRTSNTHEPYPDYYGRSWDAVHPTQARLRHIFDSPINYYNDVGTLISFWSETDPMGRRLMPQQVMERSATGQSGSDNIIVSRQVQAVIPTSKRLIEEAVEILSKGWEGMSQAERETFLKLYDPAGTGEVDQEFVEAVLANYQKIRESLNEEMTVVYESNSQKCQGMRLYYTDLVKLHICPYFLEEKNEIRKARTLIHEMAHNALLVVDRPYYRPTNKAYVQLTPNGSWLTQLPVVGPLIREIQHSDTLYHPDAYAHFTVAVSGQPVAMGMYGSHHHTTDTVGESASQPVADSLQAVDSWAMTN